MTHTSPPRDPSSAIFLAAVGLAGLTEGRQATRSDLASTTLTADFSRGLDSLFASSNTARC